MGYKEDMEHCRKFIDEHLEENLNARTLSAQFGYSFYHFCHVFHSVNGLPVVEYIRNMRLRKAAVQLKEGESVTQVSIASGFDTPSGFTKAFTRQFGLSPFNYQKRMGNIMNLTPQFKTMPKFTAVGYVLLPDHSVDIRENGAFWLGKDFSGVSLEDYQKLTYPGYAEVGMWMHPQENGELFYFFGPIVQNTEIIPDGMKAVDVPAAEYAVFKVPAGKDVKELHENINSVWKYIFNEWFDSSEYSFDESKVDFEYYHGEDTLIYVPVMKKQ